MNRGITQKQYLGLVPPTEEDARSSQMRILDALKEKGITASFTLPALQKLHPICDEADYNITVSLAWNGSIWQAVDLEAGDTAAEHYGYAADLGSTTVVVRLVNCSDGTVLAEESEYNRQTAYGTDILTRIFACKDKPEVLQDIRACTMETFTLLLKTSPKDRNCAVGCSLNGRIRQHNDDPFPAGTGSVLRLFIPVRRARRPRRIPSGERDGISHEGMCLLRAGKIQLPGR